MVVEDITAEARDTDHPRHEPSLRQPDPLAPRDRLRADQDLRNRTQRPGRSSISTARISPAEPVWRTPYRSCPVSQAGRPFRPTVHRHSRHDQPFDWRPVPRRRGRGGRDRGGQRRDHRHYAPLGVLSAAGEDSPLAALRAAQDHQLMRSVPPCRICARKPGPTRVDDCRCRPRARRATVSHQRSRTGRSKRWPAGVRATTIRPRSTAQRTGVEPSFHYLYLLLDYYSIFGYRTIGLI